MLAAGQKSDGVFDLGREHNYEVRQRELRVPPGLKPKDMAGIPWRTAFALQDDGWYLRSEIIWYKRDTMPEQVRDRPTRNHETIFMLTRSRNYFFDQYAVAEALSAGDGSRNIRTVWDITTQNFPGAHFATFPQKLVAQCLRAGTSEHGACGECGAPFRRILEARSLDRSELPKDHPEYRPARYDSGKAGDPQSPGAGQRYSQVDMLGWMPSCQCYTGEQMGLPLGPEDPHYSCHVCGAPWKVSKRGETAAERDARQPQMWVERGDIAPNRHDGGTRQQGMAIGSATEAVTVGWEPSCSCEPERRPCVVLDPFLGSGTTALVARNMGLHSVGIELNEKYAQMIVERLAQLSLLA
jgi:hypothetical protein